MTTLTAPSPRRHVSVPAGMLRTALLFTLLLAVLALAGCAKTVAERTSACSVGDWQAYGLADGKLGVPESDRLEFFEDCRSLGLEVDLAAYRAGRAEGLMYYCTVENGYEAGREGRPYHGVCTGQGDVAFRQGYDRGRKERPAYRGYGYPSIGLGLGVGSRRSWGGVGIGLPLYHSGHGYYRDRHGFIRDRHGFLVRHGHGYDACWSGPFPCRHRHWW